MEEKTRIYAMLRAKGFRVTAQKKMILDVFFDNTDRMLSISDVCKLFPENVSIDNATVYRNIQKFLSFGILEAMNDDSGINRYTICEKHHHHYLICTECGRIVRFPCSNYWDIYAKDNDFKETYHKLEVYGKCSECAKA